MNLRRMEPLSGSQPANYTISDPLRVRRLCHHLLGTPLETSELPPELPINRRHTQFMSRRNLFNGQGSLSTF
jgi:hypothetical protein